MLKRTLSISVPDFVHSDLKEAAERRQISMSQLATHFIIAGLRQAWALECDDRFLAFFHPAAS